MKYSDKYLHLLVFLILAFGASILILGVAPIKTNNTNWLFISNPDPLTHYLGWAFYKQSGWSWPIGLNPTYGLEISSSIVFSDSIPLFAILFKTINPILPDTFQYFGIWYLACLVLQGWFGWKIISLISNDVYLKCFGLLIAIFSPPMLSRIGIHAALVGHFLILAAFYIIFSPEKRRSNVYWGILLATAALVQFYIFAMLFALWIASELDKIYIEKTSSKRKFPSFLIVTSIFLMIVLWQAGYFAVTTSSANEFGFGLYRMNLFALFDPQNNYSESSWSYLLNPLPQASTLYPGFNTRLDEGSHEGFNYMGLGVLALLPFCFWALLRKSFSIKQYLSAHFFLIGSLLLLWIFALSNNISIGRENFHYPIPDWVLPLVSIFRCSGRMFWPVLYALIFAQVFIIIRAYPITFARIILGFCCLLQIADTSAGWLPLHDRLRQNSKIVPTNLFMNSFWKDAAGHYKTLRIAPLVNGQFQPRWEHIAPFAAKHHLGTNAVYLARIDQQKLKSANANFSSELINKNLDQSSLYVLDDSKILPALLHINPQHDLLAKIDNFVILAPGWKDCKTCIQIPHSLEINDVIDRPRPSKLIELNSNNPNLKLILAGGHGWGESNKEGVINKDLESKLILPLPADLSVKSLGLTLIALADPKEDE
ncbi:MAG: hypothetical protein HQ456_08770, partial [Polynucleobacter sp.]|nr:hypothetical protein [Polynucleobacter sp.]